MNISQPHESKTLKCPTYLQNRRHVAPITHIFHKLEFIKREKFINNKYLCIFLVFLFVMRLPPVEPLDTLDPIEILGKLALLISFNALMNSR